MKRRMVRTGIMRGSKVVGGKLPLHGLVPFFFCFFLVIGPLFAWFAISVVPFFHFILIILPYDVASHSYSRA